MGRFRKRVSPVPPEKASGRCTARPFRPVGLTAQTGCRQALCVASSWLRQSSVISSPALRVLRTMWRRIRDEYPMTSTWGRPPGPLGSLTFHKTILIDSQTDGESLFLGCTGPDAGKHLIEQALSQGHSVDCFFCAPQARCCLPAICNCISYKVTCSRLSLLKWLSKDRMLWVSVLGPKTWWAKYNLTRRRYREYLSAP